MGILTELIGQEFNNKRQEKELQLQGYAALLKQPNLKPDAQDRILEQMGKLAGSGKPIVGLLGAALKRGPGVPATPTSAGEEPSRGMTYSPGEMESMARQKQERDNQATLDMEAKRLEQTGRIALRNRHEQMKANLQDMTEINQKIASGEISDEVGQAEIGKIAGRTPEPTWKEGYFIPPAGDPVHVWYNTKKPNTYLDDQNKAVSLPQEKGWHSHAGETKAPTEAESKDAEIFGAYTEKHKITGALTNSQKVEARAEAAAEESKRTGTEAQLIQAHKDLSSSDPVVQAAARETLQDVELKRQQILEQSGGGELSDDDLRSLAHYDVLTGQHTELSYRDPKMRSKYEHFRASVMNDMGGPTQAAAAGGEFKATRETLSNLMKVRGVMKAGQEGTNNEINRLILLAKQIPQSDVRKFNNLKQFLQANLTEGTPLARYREALVAARYRYNSQIASFKGGGAATNQVRTETAEEVMDRIMPTGALLAAGDEMKKGLANVTAGMDKVIADTQKTLQTPFTQGRSLTGAESEQNDPLGILK